MRRANSDHDTRVHVLWLLYVLLGWSVPLFRTVVRLGLGM